MQKKIVQEADMSIALIHSGDVLVHDAQSALELLMSVCYNDNCTRIAINKEALCEGFFVLRTGYAGEILQKAANYRMRLAVIGNFEQYTSKPLRDFIYECNNGDAVFFVEDEAAAIAKLCGRG